MSSLTILSNEKLLINSLTIWFEGGKAMEAFKNSKEYDIMQEVYAERGLGELDLWNYPDIRFDELETEDEANHELTFDCE